MVFVFNETSGSILVSITNGGKKDEGIKLPPIKTSTGQISAFHWPRKASETVTIKLGNEKIPEIALPVEADQFVSVFEGRIERFDRGMVKTTTFASLASGVKAPISPANGK
jgi:hypothetical protein